MAMSSSTLAITSPMSSLFNRPVIYSISIMTKKGAINMKSKLVNNAGARSKNNQTFGENLGDLLSNNPWPMNWKIHPTACRNTHI